MPPRTPMDPHLDPDTLAAYVDGRLAASELALADRHIDACGACRSELSALAAMHTEPGAGELDSARQLARSRAAVEPTLGRYRLSCELHEVSPGGVLRAYDPELARPVAIERLREVDVRRLRDDARTLAQLRHPSLVGIYDVLEDEQGAYLVTELVEGATLRAHCQGRAPREILDACIRAGRGLAAAHDAGVVHGDVKPENVLVRGDGEIRVVAFGLGRREPASARDDQYSFCIAVHELLTGVRPGTGRAPGSVTLAASLPRGVARALRRGLARDPAARFPSMHALLAALADDPRARRRRELLWLAAVAAGVLAAAALAIATAK